jgi:hypothetical protein
MRKLMTKALLAGTAVLAMPTLAASPTKPATPAATTQTTTTNATAPETSSTATMPATTGANAPASTATTQTAAASADVAVGATVKDTSGGTVGKIEAVEGQYAVLATTKNKVRLPISSFGKGADGPILAMTQAQVDAAAASAAAKTAKP